MAKLLSVFQHISRLLEVLDDCNIICGFHQNPARQTSPQVLKRNVSMRQFF